MASKTPFQRVLGTSPTTKILEYLLADINSDHTVSDIYVSTGVSRLTIPKVIHRLVKEAVVKRTRKVGTSRLFKLNEDSPVVTGLLNLLDQINMNVKQE